MSSNSKSYEAIILGGGAAGLFCAGEAAKRGRHVLVLERAEAPGKKILISGGGRCNFTNIGASAANYLSANPHFAKSALSRYTPADFLALVESYGIAWHEKTLGQLFCDGSAKQIVAMLIEEMARGEAELRCGIDITDISHADARFTVRFGAEEASAPALIVATGGPSIPKMGATDFAYDIARQFGLKVVQPRPALVPFTLPQEDALFRDLSGVSTDVVARAGGAGFREAALFTHKGLSGPAILQASSYWTHGEPVALDLLPDADGDWLIEAKRAQPKSTMRAQLRGQLPDRLADALDERLALPGDLGNLPDAKLREACMRLSDWQFHPDGTEGFAKAEVTAGGVSTAELSSKTMAAKRVPGLYFIGEAVDVIGWLGGYNFQWAWASAHAAAVAV